MRKVRTTSPHGAPAEPGSWRRFLTPLGIPTAIVADHPLLLETACAAYADWLADDTIDEPAIEIRLRLTRASVGGAGDGIGVEGSRLTLAGPDIQGEADARTGRGRCAVPPRMIDDAAALAAEILDPILLFLLARMGRPPLHAAGILLGDAALLLAGPSGSGKSTLALAAAARGISVLSDDTVHVQLDPLRIWGLSRPVHVLPDEAPPGDHAVRERAGRRKAAITLPAAMASRRHADRAVLIVLDRGDHLALQPIPTEAALAALMRLDAGFDLLRDQSAAVIGTLAAAGAWRLTLTTDADAAITLLRESPW